MYYTGMENNLEAIRSTQIDNFAATAIGPFSFIERSHTMRQFRATAFWRVANFTGHRILCVVLAEDYESVQ